jgi:glycine/D-amino acid oxidase-like deaminating enzyme
MNGDGGSCGALVIGGGFFGCMAAVRLRKSYSRVVLCEMGDSLLGRASYHNQARVHNGYHYPRSLLTALRSHVNFPVFVDAFRSAVVDGFEKLYAVPRRLSKVNAAQFAAVMKRVGAPVRECGGARRKLFAADLIEEVFSVEEYAFDAVELARLAREMMEAEGVEVRLGSEVTSLRWDGRESFAVELGGGESLRAGRVFNCAYARVNHNLRMAGFGPVKLRHELAELCLAEVPGELRDVGVTVMCGPFFSVMPFPPRGLHTLSHVRYTPHTWWLDDESHVVDPYAVMRAQERRSAWQYMVRDAQRYLPCLREAVYRDSLWEVKTVLPQHEEDDGRPILFYRAKETPRYVSIMGGKIDNVFDCQMELDRELEGQSCR